MERMMRKASHSILLRGFAAKSHNFKRSFSCIPTIDFSSIREAKDAIRLFREMLIMSPQPSFLVYNKLLSVVAKMEEYGVALYMFDEMRHSRFPMNEFRMNIVINCCCHLNRVDLGFAVMGSFLKHNYQPDVTTFNTLLRGLFLVVKVAEAEALFENVLFFKLCQPNDFIILTVVSGLCKSGQNCKARNLLWDFEKTGYKPNVCSYNVAIDGLCKGGMVDDALHLLFEMPDKRIWPDVFTYSTIIHGLCIDGRVDDALQILFEMPNKGIKPDVVMYNTIVQGLCKDGRVDDALQILSEMPNKGIMPDVVMYSSIIQGYAQHGFMTEALQIYDSMLSNGVKPDEVTFCAVLSSCAHVGALEEALFYFDSMTKNFGITPTCYHLTCIVSIYARKGETKAAYDLVRNFPYALNEVVWISLLSGCVMNKDLVLARLAAKEILSIDPNNSSAHVMLSNVYASLNMWEEASKVRELIKENKKGCSWI